MRRSRPAIAIAAAAAALALTLAGCAPSGPDAGGTPTPDPAGSSACTASGTDAEAVTVTGDFGAAPTVTFTAPLAVQDTQRLVLSEGKGEPAANGDMLNVHFALYNGTTGGEITSTGYLPSTLTPMTVDESVLLPGIVKTLRCSTVGSRVLGVVSPTDAFGADGSTSAGVGPDTTLVFVMDIVSVVPSQASGTAQDLPDGFPEVTFADDGQPTLTIPKKDPPADLKIATLIVGDGSVVGDGDSVTVQYQGVNWTSGKVFDESWGRGAANFTTDGVIPGFGAALVGQTVGSRVIAIIPPDQGYGPQGGQPKAGIAADDTLVFVVDILSTQPAA